MTQTAGTVELSVIALDKPDDLNVILGQSHFIKTVEDLHEALAGAVPGCGSDWRSARPRGRGSCAAPGTTTS